MTSGVPPEVSLILGDFIYNVRSALDRLAAALNPPTGNEVLFSNLLEGRLKSPPRERRSRQGE